MHYQKKNKELFQFLKNSILKTFFFFIGKILQCIPFKKEKLGNLLNFLLKYCTKLDAKNHKQMRNFVWNKEKDSLLRDISG